MRWLGITRLDRHGNGPQGPTDWLDALELFNTVVLGPVENPVVVATRVWDLEHGRDLAVFEIGLRPEGHGRDVCVAHDSFADCIQTVDCEEKRRGG